tara:strand:+ start:4299 stop:4700 length:402 start_codon:yes stop_codon:yes gene_type:complete
MARIATRSQAVRKLDKVFSIYIRQRAADNFGMVNCYTCGKRKHWKEVDAGHFQSRAKFSTRWDEQNVKAQCKHCNMTNGGQQYQFGMMLDQEYGEGMAEKILIRSNQMSKLSLPELRIMIDAYKAKAKQFGLS